MSACSRADEKQPVPEKHRLFCNISLRYYELYLNSADICPRVQTRFRQMMRTRTTLSMADSFAAASCGAEESMSSIV